MGLEENQLFEEEKKKLYENEQFSLDLDKIFKK